MSPSTTYTAPTEIGAPEAAERFLTATEQALTNPILNLTAYRRLALDLFRSRGLPQPKEEAWRYTPWTRLLDLPFQPLPPKPDPELLQTISPFLQNRLLQPHEAVRLIFIDGWFVPELSQLASLTSGRVSSIQDALKSSPSTPLFTEEDLRQQPYHPFFILNAIYFQDGLLLDLPPHTSLDQPIHLIHISTAKAPGTAAHLRHQVRLKTGAHATIVMEFLSLGDQVAWSNSVLEATVEPEAHLEILNFQNENHTAVHVGGLSVQLQRKARLTCHSIALGAHFSRVEFTPTLREPESECLLNGLYLVDHDRVTDHQMHVDHAAPGCRSQEFFNGILLGNAYSLFRGRILVRPGAQKTDAHQTNRNLLLSSTARVRSQPQLEIYADDVRCTHGATVGQLDSEALFYLQSRGIPAEKAHRILIHAFAEEATDRIENPLLRERIADSIWRWIERINPFQLGAEPARPQPIQRCK